MSNDTGQRLLVERNHLARTTLTADPDALRSLDDGQARLRIERFGLSANNITYAHFGEVMQYWKFFPAADPAWGSVPVWGFATVTESRAAGVEVGRRVWGFLPMGTHLVVMPQRVRERGFVDAAAHRRELPAAYNELSFCDADPAWSAQTEGLQALFKPLFTTAVLLDDFLADNAFFGANQLLLSSASSKTAYATAYCLAQRAADRPRSVGLTSAANLAFTRSLGSYDQVLSYDDLTTLERGIATVYVDFAGSAPLRRKVHEHFAEKLTYSSSIGGTHGSELGSAHGLPGPKPTLFFAPAQLAKRSRAAPDGWGPGVVQQRLGHAWAGFLERLQRPGDAWVRIVERPGAAAAQAAYLDFLQGRTDASEGVMLNMRG